MKLATEMYSKFTGVAIVLFALAANLIAGSQATIVASAIEENKRKWLLYSNGLDISGGRQMAHRS